MTALTTRLDQAVRTAIARYSLPGLAVALRGEGHEIFATGHGVRDAQARLAVSADTLFGVASVTKVLTAIIVMLACRDGLLRLEDRVSDFYPELDCLREREARVRHLLSHSAGFPGLPFRHMATRFPHDAPASGLLNTAQLVSALNGQDIVFIGAPGERFSYSNEGYCLLGGIIERVFGGTFAEIAQTRVLGPLKMDRSVIGATAATARTDTATPLRHAKGGYRTCGFWDAPLFDPAGGLVLSARDMTRLMAALGGQAGLLARDEADIMEMTSLPVASRPASTSRYGLGLEVRQLDNAHSLLWHTGQRPGISSFAGYVRQKDLSVGVVANVAGAPAATIGHIVIAEVLGEELDAAALHWPPPCNAATPDDPQRFHGDFSSLEWPDISVGPGDGHLSLQNGSTRHRMYFAGPSHGTVADQTFCFLGNTGPAEGDETAQALALDLRLLPRRVPGKVTTGLSPE